jgi:hypothetical protein
MQLVYRHSFPKPTQHPERPSLLSFQPRLRKQLSQIQVRDANTEKNALVSTTSTATQQHP